ncbi:unnamed protein product [Meganyctiphanes norvegica]|uniref:Prostamide/prostaglandin F synthase n=1 Tax=Meganyctiphanes norvegica TaxID=48144 RepID=A0AAV2RNK3_MEGNR
MFCRVAAKELSLLAPQLSQANVRLIGIGLEKLGVEEFIEGKFFEGELYVDQDMKTFKSMKYKKMNVLNLAKYMVSSRARQTIDKGKKLQVGGNLSGEKMQNGGLMVIEAKGSDILFNYKQENPADHAENSDILQALGLKAEAASNVEGQSTSDVAVTDLECQDACSMPQK